MGRIKHEEIRMAKVGRKSNQQLSAEIDKAVRQGIINGLNHVAYQLGEAYGKAIDRFYHNYTPHYYDRTYSTYMASDLSDMWGWNTGGTGFIGESQYFKNVRQLSKNRYYVALNVDYRNIGPNPYNEPLDYVFERTYVEGIHGMTPEEAARKGLHWHKKPEREAPIHFMEKDYYKIANNENLDRVFGEAISRELSRVK